jgi:hypothetical protein
MTWTIDGSLELQNLDIFGGGKRICMIDCDDDTVSDYDHIANACLIAAAPDLLAALEYLLQQTIEADLQYDTPLSEGEQEAEAMARAAINKAKGA